MSATASHARGRGGIRLLPSRQSLPLLMTLLVFGLMYAGAAHRYDHFLTGQVFVDLVVNNGFLGIAAIGLTFVIIAGGIDLSVGSAIGFTSIFIAQVTENHHWPPALAILVALAAGTTVGLIQGLLIHLFTLQPFLITLGGLFFYRGVGLLISQESISVNHAQLVWLNSFDWQVTPTVGIRLIALVFVALVLIATYFAASRPVGRAVYALGGNEQSALLMGLPVGRVKVGVYAVSGFCAALAGVMATADMGSGDALRGLGLELDAISAVVIGGTLLSGGVGGPIGTFAGVLIVGLIQEVVNNRENYEAGWARIVVGLLLLAFVLLQTFLQPKETHS